MAQILVERGFLNAHKLPVQCKNFKCVDTLATALCCCHRILYNQPDFQAQQPELIEFIESRGHKVIFYPKFYCELNFIEQIWGAAKYCYRFLDPAALLSPASPPCRASRTSNYGDLEEDRRRARRRRHQRHPSNPKAVHAPQHARYASNPVQGWPRSN